MDLLYNKYKNIIETIYVSGGSKIYEDANKIKNFNKFYITRIFKHFDCDSMIKPKDFLNKYFNRIEDINILKEKANYLISFFKNF